MTSLYKRILASRYTILPQAIQELHDIQGPTFYSGQCNVRRGTNIINRILASLLCLPSTQDDMPLSVSFTPIGSSEEWTRHFGKDRFVTTQWEQNGLLYEKLRFITLVFALSATTQELSLNLHRILFLGVPIQWLFKPRVEAIEHDRDGVFHLQIRVHLPVTGLLVQYQGWLKRDKISKEL